VLPVRSIHIGSKEGWLRKQSSSVRKDWKKRWYSATVTRARAQFVIDYQKSLAQKLLFEFYVLLCRFVLKDGNLSYYRSTDIREVGFWQVRGHP
jgi:hypothetical protein